MSYKISIEQLHLYNKKHVSLFDAMEIASMADKEIAKLKEYEATSMRHCKVMARKVDELTAHCERLREDLKEINIAAYGCEGGCGVSSIAEHALEETPAQSLAEIQAQAIEDAVKNTRLSLTAFPSIFSTSGSKKPNA